VLNRNRLLAIVDLRDGLVLEKIQNRMIDAIQEMIANCDRCQRADETFRRGVEIVTDARPERGVVGIENDFAVPDDEQAVHLLTFGPLHHVSERAGIQTFGFGGGD
jgi:hypothetical protein